MNEKIAQHLDALSRWVEQSEKNIKLLPNLSDAERKQLQAVNKSVEQLRRNNVPIPEDLRNLKLKLSAKDASGINSQANEYRLKELESLIENLLKILKTARSIRDKLKNSEQTGGPKKHYGVTLINLLQSRVLSTDDRLQLQWVKNGPVHEGKIKADGSIMAKGPDGWKRYKSLSTAASKIAEGSLNGWKHWPALTAMEPPQPLRK